MTKTWQITICSFIGSGIILFFVGALVQSLGIGLISGYLFQTGVFLTGYCFIKYTKYIYKWWKNFNIRHYHKKRRKYRYP